MLVRTCSLAFGVLLIVSSARAEDWPQWLGTQRDGVWREGGTLDAVGDEAVKVRWRVPVGGGYAGPAVAAGRVFVTDFVPAPAQPKPAGGGGQQAPRGKAGVERVICLNEADGEVLWTREYPCTYSIDYGSGPRATPTVDGDRVYTLGAEGHLFCLDVRTGEPLWQKHFAQGKAPTPTWGYAAHPLVEGDLLICLTGPSEAGKLVTAFDKKTGEERWSALSAKEIGYCPPVIVEAGGVRQLVIWHPESVNALDPATGKVYWTQPFGPVQFGVSIATPRHLKHPKHGDLLLVSSSWDGAMMLKLDPAAPKASVLWNRAGKGNTKKGALHVLMAPPMVTDTHVFGVSNGGELRCLDAATGDVLWETYDATTGDEFANWSTAFLVPNRTPDKTFLFNEHGDMILAKLSPQGYEEVGRTKLLQPTDPQPGRPVLWCHPALANRSVYWRNDKELVCVSAAAPAGAAR